MFRTCVLTLAGTLLLAQAAPAQSREERQINAELRMLQQHTQRLELMLNKVTEVLQTLSEKLDEQASVNRKTFADLKLLSDNMAEDVQVVREKIDETNVRLGSMGQEVQALQTSMQALQTSVNVLHFESQALTDDPATDTLAPGPGVLPLTLVPQAATITPEVPPGVYPRQTFETAQSDYFSGQYSLAIQGFEAFLSYFPTLLLAGDAQYYIGESYRSDGNLQDALAAYDEVIANYPDSSSLPPARYKRASVLEALGDFDAAQTEYETVVTGHPDSDEARLAQQRLDGLLRRLP